jgi:formate-dependent phosphoribosylglycinamide formyltransferase (GAR transformylase)
MKQRAQESGILVTGFLTGGTSLSSEEIYGQLGHSLVVKDRNNSGGKGQQRFTYPMDVESHEGQLIEAMVVGKEMSVESFIQDGQIKFISTTEYQEIGVVNIVPSQISEDILKKVFEVNQQVIKSFGIENGLTHLEVYLTKDDVLFGEVAIRPPGGHIMTLMEKAHGIESWHNYIKIHLGETIPKLESRGHHAGAIVYHPGQGRVKDIIGEEELKKLKTLCSYKIRSKVGDEVPTREGVGKERANFIFCSSDREAMKEELLKTRESFKIVLE